MFSNRLMITYVFITNQYNLNLFIFLTNVISIEQNSTKVEKTIENSIIFFQIIILQFPRYKDISNNVMIIYKYNNICGDQYDKKIQ